MSSILKYILLVGLFTISACALIFDDDISDESIEVIMPVDNAILSDSITLFWWDPVVGALDYTFQLIEGSFSSPQNLVLDTLVTTEKLHLELQSGNYQWRISANGANGSTKYQLYSLEIILDEE